MFLKKMSFWFQMIDRDRNYSRDKGRHRDDRRRDRDRDRRRDDRSSRSQRSERGDRSSREWDETPKRFRDSPATPDIRVKGKQDQVLMAINIGYL